MRDIQTIPNDDIMTPEEVLCKDKVVSTVYSGYSGQPIVYTAYDEDSQQPDNPYSGIILNPKGTPAQYDDPFNLTVSKFPILTSTSIDDGSVPGKVPPKKYYAPGTILNTQEAPINDFDKRGFAPFVCRTCEGLGCTKLLVANGSTDKYDELDRVYGCVACASTCKITIPLTEFYSHAEREKIYGKPSPKISSVI